METSNEFEKVRQSFGKVKEDINYLNSNIEQIKAQKADRMTTDQIFLEMAKLRNIIIELSLKDTKEAKCETMGIVGNTDSKKVHYENCPFAKRITKEHKTSFESVQDALNHKYSKCSCIL